MFDGDESYDREVHGPLGGTPWNPPEGQQPDPAAQEAPEESVAVDGPAGPAEPGEPAPAAPATPAAAPAEYAALPPPEPTGDERVDAALARLGDLGGTPVAGHVEVFQDVQRRLQDVLAAIDHEEDHGKDHAEEEAPRARPAPPDGQS